MILCTTLAKSYLVEHQSQTLSHLLLSTEGNWWTSPYGLRTHQSGVNGAYRDRQSQTVLIRLPMPPTVLLALVRSWQIAGIPTEAAREPTAGAEAGARATTVGGTGATAKSITRATAVAATITIVYVQCR